MNKFRMNAQSRLALPAVAMLVLSGCLTPSGEPQPDNGFADPGSTNSAPTIQGNPARASTIGHVYTFVPTASDPDGDTLTFSVTNRPGWATFNSAKRSNFWSADAGRRRYCFRYFDKRIGWATVRKPEFILHSGYAI